MTQHENGVLWKLFLLSMLLQGRRDTDTRRTGEHREYGYVFVWLWVVFRQLSLWKSIGCLLHPAEWQPVAAAAAALAKQARNPSSTPTHWGKLFSFGLVLIINALPLNTQVCRPLIFFGVVLYPTWTPMLSSSDHPRRDSWWRGWDSPQERLWSEQHLKRVLPVFFSSTGYCCRVAVLSLLLIEIRWLFFFFVEFGLWSMHQWAPCGGHWEDGKQGRTVFTCLCFTHAVCNWLDRILLMPR